MIEHDKNARRTERLLALILLNQMRTPGNAEKIKVLSIAGFTTLEIADLLELKADSVSKAMYRKRSKAKD